MNKIITLLLAGCLVLGHAEPVSGLAPGSLFTKEGLAGKPSVRAHRFQKRFQRALTAKMRKLKYLQRDIDIIANQGLARIEMGKMVFASWELLELGTSVLNEVLKRPADNKITPEELLNFA